MNVTGPDQPDTPELNFEEFLDSLGPPPGCRHGPRRQGGPQAEEPAPVPRPVVTPEANEECLAPLGVQDSALGCVDPIHGGDGHECPEYRPTRHELRQLARYWRREQLDTELTYFFHATGGGDWSRLAAYGGLRLARIARAIGEEGVVEEAARAEWKAARGMGADRWRVFLRGTRQERDAIWDEVAGRGQALDRVAGDVAACRAALAHLRDHPLDVYRDEEGNLWVLCNDPCGATHSETLCLKVVNRHGDARLAAYDTVPRPAGWSPPYGL